VNSLVTFGCGLVGGHDNRILGVKCRGGRGIAGVVGGHEPVAQLVDLLDFGGTVRRLRGSRPLAATSAPQQRRSSGNKLSSYP
jgi:hypothetical protein